MFLTKSYFRKLVSETIPLYNSIDALFWAIPFVQVAFLITTAAFGKLFTFTFTVSQGLKHPFCLACTKYTPESWTAAEGMVNVFETVSEIFIPLGLIQL